VFVQKPKKVKIKNRLTEVDVSEISIVDTPANRCKFLLYKRDEENTPSDGLDLLQRIQEGADELKTFNSALYKRFNQHPEEFDYQFEDGKLGGRLTIRRRVVLKSRPGNFSFLARSPEPDRPESTTHKWDPETGKWRPRRLNRG